MSADATGFRINEVRDVGNNRGPELSNLTIVGPPNFGFVPDTTFAGPGVFIKYVYPGYLADIAGMKPGDVLTSLDGVDVKTEDDAKKVLYIRILAKKKGDAITGRYRRGDQNRSFRFDLPELPRTTIFKRTGQAGRLEVKADGNKVEVTARSVARYDLLIDRRTFDLDQPIQVVTNGKESYHDRAKPDLRFMLEQAAADDDRSTVYVAKIEITVPPGTEKGQP